MAHKEAEILEKAVAVAVAVDVAVAEVQLEAVVEDEAAVEIFVGQEENFVVEKVSAFQFH